MKNIILVNLLFIGLLACKSTDSNYQKTNEDHKELSYECCEDGAATMLPRPINICRKGNENNYFELDPCKDESVFIEIDKNNPLKERLWFVSSRDDSLGSNSFISNYNSQIYYVDRILDSEKGACPSEAWIEDSYRRLIVKNNPKFNSLNKGSVWIVGDTMFISAQKQISATLAGKQYLNLWFLTRDEDGEWTNPKMITENTVSQEYTWESNPTVSSDGKHMFFASTRKLSNPVESQAHSDIYYSRKGEDGLWSKPIYVAAINSEFDDETPRLHPSGEFLMYSTQKYEGAPYQVFRIRFEDSVIGLDFEGIPETIESELTPSCSNDITFEVNNPKYNQRYPFWYSNPANKYEDGEALLWSHDRPVKTKDFEDKALNIYGCALQSNRPRLEVVVMDLSTGKMLDEIEPVIELLDEKGKLVKESYANKLTFPIQYDKNYKAQCYTESFNKCDKQNNIKVYGFFPFNQTKKVFGENKLQDTTIIRTEKVNIKDFESEKSKYPSTSVRFIDTIMNNTKVEMEEITKENLLKVEVPEDYKDFVRVFTIEKTVSRFWDILITKTDIDKYDIKNTEFVPYTDLFSGMHGPRKLSERSLNNDLYISSSNPLCILRDTIWIAPRTTELPLCTYDFAEYFSHVDKDVSFFQTGFWELNTSHNFNRHLELLKKSTYSRTFKFEDNNLDGFEPPESQHHWDGAKWIELHPYNTMLSQKSEAGRIAVQNEYKRNAAQINNIFEGISKEINHKLIPAFEFIHDVEADATKAESKFVLAVEAWSDQRHVSRGWYWPAKQGVLENISYASGSIQYNVADPGFKLVSIDRGDALGKYNHVLSGLRAYFGYKELIKYLNQNNSKFAEYYEKGLVLDPEQLVDEDGFLLSDSEITELIKEKKIIIMARGYSTLKGNEGHTTPERYKDSRKIRIVVQNIQFLDGRFGNEDGCCNDNFYSVEETDAMQAMDSKRYEDKAILEYIILFGVFEEQNEAKRHSEKLFKKTGQSFVTDRISTDKGNLYRVYIEGFDSYKSAALKLQVIKESYKDLNGKVALKVFPKNTYSIDAGKYIVLDQQQNIEKAKQTVLTLAPKIRNAFKAFYAEFDNKSFKAKQDAYETYMILPMKPFLKMVYDNEGNYLHTLVLMGPYNLTPKTEYESEDIINSILKPASISATAILDITSKDQIDYIELDD